MNYSPLVVVDRSLPYLQGVLERYVTPIYLPSEEITNELLRREGVEAILCRSVLKCNSALLDGTQVRFIATATAGIDHVDTDYCREKGIFFTNAPGCNATSVACYVFAVLAERAIAKQQPIGRETLGIIGVGNVGREVLRFAEAFDMACLLNDPPRQEKEHRSDFIPLEELLSQSDIITFHVPLVKEGPYATYHLLDQRNITLCKQGTFLVNASRGGVVSTQALQDALSAHAIADAAIDCWEGEPKIATSLLSMVCRSTPHIAGFSAESKARGSAMITAALLRFFAIDKGSDGAPVDLRAIAPAPPEDAVIDASDFGSFTLERCLLHGIDLPGTETILKQAPHLFEQHRVSYSYHREPISFRVRGALPRYHSALRLLGFALE